MKHGATAPTSLTYDKGQFNLRCVPFTAKMIKRYLRGGSNSAIIELDIESCDADQLPRKGEFCFIGEPFRRRYGQDGKYNILHSVRYEADRTEKIINEVEQQCENFGELLPANAMLEYEARFFIRVRSCKYRYVRSLRLKNIIHDNLYNVRKSHRVVLLTFDIATLEQINNHYIEREREAFIENYF